MDSGVRGAFADGDAIGPAWGVVCGVEQDVEGESRLDDVGRDDGTGQLERDVEGTGMVDDIEGPGCPS